MLQNSISAIIVEKIFSTLYRPSSQLSDQHKFDVAIVLLRQQRRSSYAVNTIQDLR